MAWAFFKDKFLTVLNKIAPYKEIRIKQLSEPWINSEILDLIDQRDSYLSKFSQTKAVEDHKKHLHYRNQVNYKIKKAKTMYFKDNVSENQNRPKKFERTRI